MSDFQALQALIQDYFDALYEGDTEKFARVFHPAARLYTSGPDGVISLDFESYMARVAGRPSSASRGDARDDEIVSLVIPAPTIAHAVVKDCYLPSHFVTYLAFVKEGGRWVIVAKTWHTVG